MRSFFVVLSLFALLLVVNGLCRTPEPIRAANPPASQNGNADDPSKHVGDKIAVSYAKAVEEVTRFTWQKSVEANRQNPGRNSKSELTRLELETHRAKLMHERAKLDKQIADVAKQIKAAKAKKTDSPRAGLLKN